MLSLLPLLALGLCVSAASIPRQITPCTFSMTAVGEPNGTIVEDTIGENRIGGGFPQGIYYANNHSLFDSLNHNCLIWPHNFQFQCTQGAAGATNFTLADDGNLMHDASEKWYACPSAGPGDDGSYNIFSDALPNTAGCELVTLRTGGFSCSAMGRPSSSAAPTATATGGSPLAATSSPAAACPTDISAGTFQFPHLIVPTSSQDPDYAFGDSFKPYISPVNTTLFNFDIPATAPYTGTCSLLFLFPYGTDLAPSAGMYSFSGIEEEIDEKGGLDFALLSGIASTATTYDSTPAVATDYGKTVIIPGNNYTIATFPCQSGTAVTYSVSSVNNVVLGYFQDDAPSAIGVYIVPCA